MQENQKVRRIPVPENKPWSLHETGVRESILEDLALKTLYLAGPFSVLKLAELARLSLEVADQLFDRMRSRVFCQVTGMTGNVPNISITSQGRARALELLSQNQYAGVAPVSLESYVEQVRRQSVRHVEVHLEDVERGFRGMVVDPGMLAQLGTALNSGTAIFIYGPPGVGKTAAAETLSRVLAEDSVWIPHAIEVEGQIITVYDPAVHRRVDTGSMKYDERWVRCQRPAALVGGELTVEMLDLQFNPVSKYYVGPIQMKANNGVLIIDDFGRQRIPPEELLNRWVVPLDRRIDFLSMVGGRKIEIPFEMLVVFASNLNPAKLMDPAFLRRIQTKIKIGPASAAQFSEIFRRVAADHKLEVDDQILEELMVMMRDVLHQPLLPCHPRDLISQILWAAKYQGVPPAITRETVMRAVENYFVPPE
jgi:predicted ATPase with chaperone activity